MITASSIEMAPAAISSCHWLPLARNPLRPTGTVNRLIEVGDDQRPEEAVPASGSTVVDTKAATLNRIRFSSQDSFVTEVLVPPAPVQSK